MTAPTMKRTTRQAWRLAINFAALLLLVTASLSACTASDATETRSHSFTGTGLSLKVDTANGSVELISAPGETIKVDASIRDATRLDYKAVQEGDTVRITAQVQRSGWFYFGRGPGVNLKISAPPGTSMRVATSNGSMDVAGFTAGGTLRTSNGHVELEDVQGNFNVRSSNGHITAVRASGWYDLETSNGRIEFTGELEPGGASRLVTSNGPVTVRLSGQAGLRVDATTSNGRINVNLPIQATVLHERHIVGVIGDGASELVIRTSNGTVTVE